MRYQSLLILLFWVQCFILSHAAGAGGGGGGSSSSGAAGAAGRAGAGSGAAAGSNGAIEGGDSATDGAAGDPAATDPEPADPPQPAPAEPVPPPNDDPSSSGGGSSGGTPLGDNPKPKGNVPGALNQGLDPEVSPGDDQVDIEEIGEKLKDLIDDISSLADVVTATSTSTGTTGAPITITVQSSFSNRPIPTGASACTSAQSAYAACSSANAVFSALPRTQQAGCLCNAQPNIDFNSNMLHCYNWAHGQTNATNSTMYQSYAAAIASATSLCAPCQTASANSTLGSAVSQACPSSGASVTQGAGSTQITAFPSQPPVSGVVGGWNNGKGYRMLLMALGVALTSVVF